MKPQPDHCHRDIIGKVEYSSEDFHRLLPQKEDREIKAHYLPGETVYIKETWGDIDYDQQIVYKAECSDDALCVFKSLGGKWKSPLFMPEWAARSHARIVSVRPERVQEITPDEVKKEGLLVQDFAGMGVLSLLGFTPETYMESVAMQEYQYLWESLYPGSWERNDWVWRIELEKQP
jgi:hypothetical protein